MSCHTRVFPAPTSLQPATAPSAPSVRPLLRSLQRLLNAMLECRRRQALLDLSDRMLDDIGITREDAERIARKPFWK